MEDVKVVIIGQTQKVIRVTADKVVLSNVTLFFKRKNKSVINLFAENEDKEHVFLYSFNQDSENGKWLAKEYNLNFTEI